MFYVKLKDIKKSFYNGGTIQNVLKNINIEVKSGEFVAIVGRSGSGKSTLMNIIGGLDKPDSGEVWIGKNNIVNMQEDELCSFRLNNIGFIFQAYNLIPVLTVKENIKLPQIKEDEEYIDKLLRMLEIEEKSNVFPNELSGGQQQRVAIARALINNPSVIIADEPTGNLDTVTEKKVLDILKKCQEELGTSIIMVTHNLEIANKVDRVIKIEDGEILSE
ncbi:ABC transporter ATP-binding protein [uncultured Clostridium sp.]|uniref:ABC transporter ATP-binding protein n=1 Tax=uncultured Clostridium sp. TaxID=59620 RepID=UPI0025E8A1A2|nr:ABC transporter ATP-binding protein [uncultured Clostridium sp.]